ncbi:chromosome partitioning protein [Micromonospora sediminicola]|uniref:chromosome partitioning protein n=1 Tax=Micromonospora sediminicola TaxID=946078 RepID=UPI0037A006FC
MPWPLPFGEAPPPPPVVPAPEVTRPAEPVPPPGVPVPDATRPLPVDLDLPFTLDQPAPGTPPAPRVDAPTTAATHGPPTVPGSGAPTSGADDAPPAAPGTDAPTSGTDALPGAPVSGIDSDAAVNGRAESPWAQPPQRAASETAGPTNPADTATAAGRPAAPNPGPATAGPGPTAMVPAHPGPASPDPANPGPPGPGPAPGPGPGPGPAGTEPSTAGPVPPGPVSAWPATGSAPVPSPSTDGPGGSAEEGAPRLGPFPPSPGVPMQQPPYGNGAAYPPPGYPPQPGQPGWYPPGWPHQNPTPHQSPGPHQAGAPHQAGPVQPHTPPAPGPAGAPPQPPYPEQGWTPQQAAPPTAEDFARRRQARPVDPVATMGVRAVVNRMGLVRLAPGRHEQEVKRDIDMVRRNFGGLRQVTVVNPKGGAGKTVAILLLAMTFGQKRGGYVLAWDNNETQGTLGMRAQQDFHARTVRDMLRDLAQFQGPHGRVGDLSQYVRSQGEGMFDVLASDESATGGEMLTAAAFAEIREVVSRFYKLIFVDTGNNVRAQNWQAAMDATDQLVVTMSARNDSAETAARMLDHLEQSGRQRLVRQAVTVVSMPPSRKEIDLPAIQAHFAARTRAVLLAPYERLIDTGEPLRYGQLSSATRDAWLKIAASVAEGL